MDTRFDLYLIKDKNESTKFNKVLDELYNLMKDVKDLGIKVYFTHDNDFRDYRPGSIRLVGYFDNEIFDTIDTYTSFCRVSKDRLVGVELYSTNAKYGHLTVDIIKNNIEKAIEFFNKLITKIN